MTPLLSVGHHLFTICGSISVGIALLILLFPRRLYRVSGSWIGVVLLGGSALILFGNAGEMLAETPNLKLFWDKVEYIGIVSLPTVWAVYAMAFAGKRPTKPGPPLRKALRIALVAALPAVFMVLLMTRSSLFWTVTSTQPFVEISKDYKPLYWVLVAMSLATGIAGVLVLYRRVRHGVHLYRRQLRMLIIALAIPVSVSLVKEVFGFNPLAPLDPGPLAIALGIWIGVLAVPFLRKRDIRHVSRREVFSSILDAAIVVSNTGRITDANAAAVRLASEDGVRLAGRLLADAWPELARRAGPLGEFGDQRNLSLETPRGDRHFDVSVSPIYTPDGDLLSLAVLLRDITDRRDAEVSVQRALAEKEILLKEIHHRVKNNLQIISSIFALQARSINDPKILDLYEETQHRVQAMALIHDALHRSGDLASIDIAGYVNELCAILRQTYESGDRRVNLEVEIDGVQQSIDRAIPCGLILNELISNSLRHAFPEVPPDRSTPEEARRIWVNCSEEAGRLRLVVGDNGVGLPKGVDFRKSDTLGLQLVCLLCDQLGAELYVENEVGTRVEIVLSPSEEG